MFMAGPWAWAQSPEQAAAKATEKGEEGEPGDSAATDEIKTLEARLAEVDGKIEEASAQETAAAEGTLHLPLDAIQARSAALRKLKAAVQQRLSVLRVYGDILERRDKAETALGEFQRLEQPPPYTIDFLDQMSTTLKVKRTDVEAETMSLNTARERVEMERPDIATAKATLNRAEERLRTASQEERESAAFNVETERLLLEANQAELDAASMEVKRSEAYVKTLDLDLELAKRKTDWVRRQTVFSQEELDALTARQQKAIDDLSLEIEETQKKIETLKTKLPAAEQKAIQETDP